jgi:hypothetical protein
MIDVKQAVKIATDYAKELFSDQKFEQITLEEVELDEDAHFWNVTLGMGKIVHESPFGILAGVQGKLMIKYKVVKINAATGSVQSVKIREA